MGTSESSLKELESSDTKLKADVILSKLGFDVKELDADKQEGILEYLRNTAQTLVNFISDGTSTSLALSIASHLNAHAHEADSIAEMISNKISKNVEIHENECDASESSISISKECALLSDVSKSQRRIKKFICQQTMELHEELLNLSRAIAFPEEFKERFMDGSKELENDQNDQSCDDIRKIEDSNRKKANEKLIKHEKKPKKERAKHIEASFFPPGCSVVAEGKEANWTTTESAALYVEPAVSKGVVRATFRLSNTGEPAMNAGVGICASPIEDDFSTQPGLNSRSCLWSCNGSLTQGADQSATPTVFHDEEEVSVEVDVDKRVVVFFKGEEACMLCLTSIPHSVQFVVYARNEGATATIVSMTKIKSLSVDVNNLIPIEWHD
ncbi:uncharacterized protein MONOS_12428 [Monocercomonoides exilis]|uniref:uncharacterized protein n=1 Tax=Monocercomonoides exilis TaxID=2049356 RepID=UPI00355A95A7|nr:hypothetical protein MONOS_12428 [Monocercomonoides exilis]|eukprot:MONOS_12428.1-p1 / transcript=MONOS_12428.1 / gene=MONOS_12428 / organism=Monocercomonoides_exilis_PA203 / gene_product=unspecified product / transcript_product=unspecified product / location=Mono_scaffold00688:12106-13583(+) / protein_length=385 / sequence_SO=supercontig / SO=protein_coding / is_pseudo=false